MSDLPKYREHPHVKMDRLALGKPHIFWSRIFKEWVYNSTTDTKSESSESY